MSLTEESRAIYRETRFHQMLRQAKKPGFYEFNRQLREIYRETRFLRLFFPEKTSR